MTAGSPGELTDSSAWNSKATERNCLQAVQPKPHRPIGLGHSYGGHRLGRQPERPRSSCSPEGAGAAYEGGGVVSGESTGIPRSPASAVTSSRQPWRQRVKRGLPDLLPRWTPKGPPPAPAPEAHTEGPAPSLTCIATEDLAGLRESHSMAEGGKRLQSWAQKEVGDGREARAAGMTSCHMGQRGPGSKERAGCWGRGTVCFQGGHKPPGLSQSWALGGPQVTAGAQQPGPGPQDRGPVAGRAGLLRPAASLGSVP